MSNERTLGAALRDMEDWLKDRLPSEPMDLSGGPVACTLEIDFTARTVRRIPPAALTISTGETMSIPMSLKPDSPKTPPSEDLVSHRVWLLLSPDPKKWWLSRPVEFQLAPRPRVMGWKPGAQEWGDPVDRLEGGKFCVACLVSYEETYLSEGAALEALRSRLSALYAEVNQSLDAVNLRLDRVRITEQRDAATLSALKQAPSAGEAP